MPLQGGKVNDERGANVLGREFLFGERDVVFGSDFTAIDPSVVYRLRIGCLNVARYHARQAESSVQFLQKDSVQDAARVNVKKLLRQNPRTHWTLLVDFKLFAQPSLHRLIPHWSPQQVWGVRGGSRR